MDTASVIASALAAGAVAIGVAGRVAHHQARGGRTDAARQELAAVVAPLRAELTSYRAGMSTGLRRDNTSHGQDYVLASEVLAASHRLPYLRRRGVQRRCRRLVGPYWMSLAEVQPADTPNRTMGTLIAAEVNAAGTGLDKSQATAGLLHRALAASDDALLGRLARLLDRLAAARW